MRRIYYTDTPERRRALQEALLTLRQARRAIDPAVLESMRSFLVNRMTKEETVAVTALAEARIPEGHETVMDRKKNLSTIMKFLEIKGGSDPSFRNKIRGLLQE